MTDQVTIHHATAKKAEGLGIALSVVDFNGEDMVRAFHPELNIELHYANGPDAVTAMTKVAEFVSANAGVKVTQEDDDGEIQYRITNEGGCLALEFDLDAALTTAAENLSEGTWVDAETGEQLEGEEEDEAPGSVVSEVFKARYKERGRKQDCGDWLALQLEDLTRVTVQDGEKSVEIVDMDRLQTLLGANDVDYNKYLINNPKNRGWQGRFRMTTRMILAKRVADKGFLFVPSDLVKGGDEERKAPVAWCKLNATKIKEDKPKRAPKAKAEKPAKGE
jgi:hypothetical protein